ncbi:putative transcriptional regulator [Nostocoides japonicum T1-X7]|uniref:Putative transcriptional regulator n=1 Tax=Nostocoides japonicum T1-X7 TaxID=1194083 RepID=A0A077LUH0_9MICO|nr:cobalamin B12-binding domain-containing protein [Tetrasphaera japonica]CCH76287.1 putative transcriptional regulator [Tetrasphaera japonica T1-X7]
MYTIKRAAELTGVSVPTLRAWERRYEVVSPERSGGGYRLYDDAAVDALSLMNCLVHDGWTASLAAEEVRRRLAENGPPDAPRRPSEELSAAAQDGGERSSWARSGTGSAPLDPLPTLDLLTPASRLDATAVGVVLDEAFSRASFETVVDDWLMPALRELGEAWADGRVTVAGEHLVAHAVQRRLAAAFEAAGSRPARAPRALVGLPEGARHELGILAFAVAARRAGIGVVYLGADLPATDWVAAVGRGDPDVVVLAVPTPSDVAALRRLVVDLWRTVPRLRIAVGGDWQSEAPEECLRLGHRIGDAARDLAQVLSPLALGP